MSGNTVTSTPALLGKNRQLFAFVTTPEKISRDVGVIILNAGLLHNVGPHRLHVGIAERLAAAGFPVIRLDQSGKGESPSRVGKSREDAMIMDYQDCLNELSKFGVHSTILAGLCSGADDGLLIASRENSVKGLILLDGYSRRTWRYFLTHYRKRALSLDAWTRLMRRLLRHKAPSTSPKDTTEAAINIRGWSTDKEMRRSFRHVLGRGACILGVFTSGQDYYNAHGQLTTGLGLRSRSEGLDEIFFEDADHTYTVCEHRERLLDVIVDWSQRNF